ncbi:unnamed protein product [Amoebophrya sp. A120]|nr:unnamed protein product [Amoebophrya sp. A120]|eukprot:GSA120T00023931001.1
MEDSFFEDADEFDREDDGSHTKNPPSQSSNTLYRVLSVEPTASPEEIRNSFHNLSRVLHPDKKHATRGAQYDSAGVRSGASASSPSRSVTNPRTSENASGDDGHQTSEEDGFLRLDRAYRILSDPTLRNFYDKYGEAGIRVAVRVPKEKYRRRSGDEEDAHVMYSDDDEDNTKIPSLPPRDSQIIRREKIEFEEMQALEQAVKQLMRNQKELEIPRRCGLQGGTTFGFAADGGRIKRGEGILVPRDLHLQYCVAPVLLVSP